MSSTLASLPTSPQPPSLDERGVGVPALGAPDDSSATALPSWPVWRADLGIDVVYLSDAENEKLQLEDEEKDEWDEYSTPLHVHLARNQDVLTSILPSAAELQSLQPARRCEIHAGAHMQGDSSSVTRLQNPVTHYPDCASCISSGMYVCRHPARKENAYFLITRPSASRMMSGCLHPSTYRPDGVGSLDLEGVAAIFGLDSEWTDLTSFIDDAFAFHDGSLSIDDENRREDYSRIMRALLRFLRSNAERSVETHFWGLLAEIGAFPSIGVTVDSSDQRKFAVGGMLAFPNYAVHGITDATYVLENRSSTDPASNSSENYMFLTTECKTNKTFPKENLWYRGTRGAQVLGALWSGYGANTRAPTLLLSPKKYKMFIFSANTAKSELHLHQFPGGYTSGNTDATAFLKLLVLILQAAKQYSEPQEMSTPVRLSSAANSLPKEVATSDRPTRSTQTPEIERNLMNEFQMLGVSNSRGSSQRQKCAQKAGEGSTQLGDSCDNRNLFDWTGKLWAVDPSEIENIEPM
jgi:hypothetical protein